MSWTPVSTAHGHDGPRSLAVAASLALPSRHGSHRLAEERREGVREADRQRAEGQDGVRNVHRHTDQQLDRLDGGRETSKNEQRAGPARVAADRRGNLLGPDRQGRSALPRPTDKADLPVAAAPQAKPAPRPIDRLSPAPPRPIDRLACFPCGRSTG